MDRVRVRADLLGSVPGPVRTEERLRQARRAGDPETELRARMRAGEISRAAVEIKAYSGDRVARAVLGERMLHGCMTDRSCARAVLDESFDGEDFVCVDLEGGTRDWARGVVILLQKLDPVIKQGECPELHQDPLRHVEGVLDMASLRCPLCLGTGVCRTETSPSAWWQVKIANGVARACLEGWRCQGCHEEEDLEFDDLLNGHGDWIPRPCTCSEVVELIDRVQAWLQHPTGQRETLWWQRVILQINPPGWVPVAPPWVCKQDWLGTRLEGAERRLNWSQVREEALAALGGLTS